MSTVPTQKLGQDFMIGALLTLPYQALHQSITRQLEARGFPDLTPSHAAAMRVLEPGGSRLTEMAGRAGMTKQSMKYLIDQLEGTGYVAREPDPMDRRAQVIRHTERGWRYAAMAAELVHELELDWSRKLGADKMRRLKRLLAELADALGFRFTGSLAEASALAATARRRDRPRTAKRTSRSGPR
jgi:DNA-binding MarR family transcriptional regulator